MLQKTATVTERLGARIIDHLLLGVVAWLLLKWNNSYMDGNSLRHIGTAIFWIVIWIF